MNKEEYIYYVIADDTTLFKEPGTKGDIKRDIDVEFRRKVPILRRESNPPDYTDEMVNHGFTEEEGKMVREELEKSGEWKNVRVERYEIKELYKKEVIDGETRNGCVDRRTFAEAAGAQGEYGFAHGKLDSGIEVELTAKLRELEDCEPFGAIFSCGYRGNE